MFVKAVKGDSSKLFPCTHVQVTRVSPESPAAKQGLAEPGTTVELIGVPGFPAPVLIALPEDFDIAYLMNQEGRTVEVVRPPGADAERKAV